MERVVVIEQLEPCATTHHRERPRAARVPLSTCEQFAYDQDRSCRPGLVYSVALDPGRPVESRSFTPGRN